MQIKLSPTEKIPFETLRYFYSPLSKTTMSNSIWDNKPVASTEKDYSNSKFLDKRLIGVPEGMTLRFTALTEKDQDGSTPDEYKTATGTTWFFYFQDESGKEFELEQKNEAGKFYKAMQAEKVEPGEVINIKREGTGFETVWTITRVGVDVKNEDVTLDKEGQPIPF